MSTRASMAAGLTAARVSGPRRRTTMWGRTRIGVARLTVGAALLAAWQAADLWVVSNGWISSPVRAGGRLVELVSSGTLWTHVSATLEVAAVGLVLGVIVGAVLGIGMGLAPMVGTVLEPFVMIFYTLPRIALAPLFIMYLGIGTVSKIGLTFTMVVFVVLLTTYQATQTVDRDLVDGLRTMRASRLQIIRWVILPSITPWMFAAIRISIGLALLGAIVAEFIASSRGLGWYMQHSAALFDVTGVFAGMVVFAVAAALANVAVAVAERRLLAWRTT